MRTAKDVGEPPGKLHTVFQVAHHTASAIAAYAASLIPAKSRSFDSRIRCRQRDLDSPGGGAAVARWIDRQR